MTLLQQEPSAHAPWTKTIVELGGNSLFWAACAEVFATFGARYEAPADSANDPPRTSPRDAAVSDPMKLRRSISFSLIVSCPGTPSSRPRFRGRESRSQSVLCRGTELLRRASLSETLRRPPEEKTGHSCPRSRARAASICESILEISDRASHSTRSRETNRAESLCCPGARAGQYRACTTPALRSLDPSRRGCTASASL